MTRYLLLVKGSAPIAVSAAIAHNCFYITSTDKQEPHSTTLHVSTESDLNLWFCEPPSRPPYPDGTLLFWSEEPTP